MVELPDDIVEQVRDELGIVLSVGGVRVLRAVYPLIAARVRAEAVAELCGALSEPVETPGDHPGEPPYRITWERALDIARGRTAVWSDLLRRAAVADAEWLAEYRGRAGAAVLDPVAEAVAAERQRIIGEFAKGARVAFKAEGETDAQRLLEVAARIADGYRAGGPNTTEATARLLRFVAGFLSAEPAPLAAGSVPIATPEPIEDAATLLGRHAAYISRTVTASYPDGMDSELVMRRRVGKIFVEAGELGDAIEGWTGENPRKGVYATREDVIKELIDCASASLCAIEYLTGDAGLSVGMVAKQVIGNAQRLSESIPDRCGPEAGPVATPTGPVTIWNQHTGEYRRSWGDLAADVMGLVDRTLDGEPAFAHLGVVQASLPPGLAEVAGGTEAHCRTELERWVAERGLRDGERALIVAVVAETVAEPGVGVYTVPAGQA